MFRNRFLATALVAVCMTLPAVLLAGCRENTYLNRRDTASFSSGDAKAANAAIQTIDPWPAYAKDTRLKHNGARIEVGMERYKQNKSIEPKGLATSKLSAESVGTSGEGQDGSQ
ncbi:MAG: hypothetical protein VX871_11785 [Pseudomonadota bacterium]|nr:hypothetical protein [Pseudomonadota bacterium]